MGVFPPQAPATSATAPPASAARAENRAKTAQNEATGEGGGRVFWERTDLVMDSRCVGQTDGWFCNLVDPRGLGATQDSTPVSSRSENRF